MLGAAWIDRPVDTQGLRSCFHVFLSAAWKRSHAQANDRHSSGVFAMPHRGLCPDDPKRVTRTRRRSAVSETRKLAAILVSDVVGYSRLAGADEDRTLARLRALRSDLIDPTISVHHGRIVKRTGDGSVIEFRSVVDAVRCATEVQHAMVERNAGVALDKRIEFRIGIHLGDVVEESDGDLMGDGVNIAARLEGVCEPGAICLSEDAYRQVKGRLDLAVSDLGQTQLKNIAEPIRVYSLRVGIPPETKPALANPAIPTSPPVSKKRPALTPLFVALAALLVLIGGGAWWFLNANRPAPVASKASAEAARISIVVLPFTNLSNDPAQDYFADGVTENLTTELSRLHNSFVIARNTAFTFKGKNLDAKEIGKDLAFATCSKARCSATEPVCASTPSSLTRNPARMSGRTDSRTTSWTCSSSRTKWSRAWPARFKSSW